jgi:hypothetical protein
MDIEDVVLVAAVRQDVRSRELQVDAAEIPHRVEAAQAGKPVHIDSVDVSPAVPTNGAVEQASSSLDQEPPTKARGEFHITCPYTHLTLVHAAWIWGQPPPPSPINSKQEGQPSTIGEVECMHKLVC